MTTPVEDMRRLTRLWRRIQNARYNFNRERRVDQFFWELERVRIKHEHLWARHYNFPDPGLQDPTSGGSTGSA